MNQQIDKLHEKAKLLAQKSMGTLTSDEKCQLDHLMDGDERYDSFLHLLGDADFVNHELSSMRQVDYRKAYHDMEKRISLRDKLQVKSEKFNDNVNDNRHAGAHVPVGIPHSLFSISHWIKVAAVLALLVVGGAFWYHHGYTRVTPPKISEEVQAAMQMSRESGHAAADVETFHAQQSSPITQEVSQLYHVDENFAEQLEEAMRITTYHDKEYWVTLDDGTLVHLNYNSRLIYPEKFGDRRDVILEGEAYFMVAKDKSRQFVVHTPQGDIKVYGTEFMVNTADNMNSRMETPSGKSTSRQATSVVLVEGSISFTPENGNELMMSPGQKLLADKDQLLVTTTDTVPFVAWNTGLFVFKKSTLENLMNVISRWYGVKDVSYSNEKLRKIHFTGNFKRYGNIERILEAIMMTCDISITFHNNMITIEER